MRPIGSLLDMPIITVDEATRLGTLKGVELEPLEGRLLYLRVKPEGSASGGVIPWSAVRSVGRDAIIVHTEGALLESVPDVDRDRVVPCVGDRPVLTESGLALGNITGYDVDEVTGRITQYHVGSGSLLASLTGSSCTIPHGAIRTFGRDAIIVADAATAADGVATAGRAAAR